MIKLDPSQPAKAAFSLLDEFKAFAFKGNVIDLAVGVVIGGAFGKVIDALVKSIILPLVGVLLPGPSSYESWSINLRGQVIPYGRFIAELVNFLIVAAALFVFIVKFLGWISRFRAQQKARTTPELTRDQELLTEIRDLLRQKGM